jgi:hypothetical protein
MVDRIGPAYRRAPDLRTASTKLSGGANSRSCGAARGQQRLVIVPGPQRLSGSWETEGFGIRLTCRASVRFKQLVPLDQRLDEQPERLRKEAQGAPPRDSFAKQAGGDAAHMQDWLTSPGLQAPQKMPDCRAVRPQPSVSPLSTFARVSNVDNQVRGQRLRMPYHRSVPACRSVTENPPCSRPSYERGMTEYINESHRLPFATREDDLALAVECALP